jgi:hypothetical protein
MTYILRVGPWHIGPFSTHISAQHFAETHGCDDYTLIPLDDPAEAPGMIHRLRMAQLKHPMARCANSARTGPQEP